MYWIAFLDSISKADEEGHLRCLGEGLGSIGNLEYRLADLGEFNAWEREDLRLRSAHLTLL